MRHEIPKTSICLPLNNHNPSIVLQSDRGQSPGLVDGELARVHAACWGALGVGQFARRVVNGPCDEGVGGDGGAVLGVEVRDLERGDVAFGGEEVLVVRLQLSSKHSCPISRIGNLRLRSNLRRGWLQRLLLQLGWQR
jgi:hypothetical protein